jgi:hypothetical protein
MEIWFLNGKLEKKVISLVYGALIRNRNARNLLNKFDFNENDILLVSYLGQVRDDY